MKLQDLLRGVPVLSLSGNDQEEVQGVAYSSKAAAPGFLFAALKGTRKNGSEYVKEALEKGAVAILSEKPVPAAFPATWIQVGDAREALGLCSANFYGHPSLKMKIIGITGTKGKTTTTYILAEIIRRAGGVPGLIGTIVYSAPGLEVEAVRTTPEAPDLQKLLKEMLEVHVTHCIMEVSSHALDLKRVWGTSFDIALFTNLSAEHLDYHHTLEEYFESKKKLFFLDSKKRTAVVNCDDPWGKKLITELPMATITFGLEPEALVRGETYKLNSKGVEMAINHPGGQMTVSSPLVGKHNLYNILAAAAAALALNIPPASIKAGIAGVQGIPGRFEKIENDLGLHIFVDYAHTDNALRHLLETARNMKYGRILLVFGAGGDRDKSKRERMGEVAGELADQTFLTSDNPRSEEPLAIIQEIEKGLKKAGAKNYEIFPDRREAIARAIAAVKKGDCILVAGKGHEIYQVIKGQQLPFNDAEVIRTILKEMKTSRNG
jgi:UDP-N-acetylmuramoyl-L-alanyl-D-glutamate--2,6-diaminopimelate ligase